MIDDSIFNDFLELLHEEELLRLRHRALKRNLYQLVKILTTELEKRKIL